MLSIQDPPGARRMERERAEAWRSCQPGRWGLSRGGVHLLQVRQCMGSRWEAQGALGVSTYRLLQVGRPGKGPLLRHSGVQRTWTLVFGGPRKVVAIKQQSFAFLLLWLPQPLPLVPRWAGCGCGTEDVSLVPSLSCTLFSFLSLPMSSLLEMEKRPGNHKGREEKGSVSRSLVIPAHPLFCFQLWLNNLPSSSLWGEKLASSSLKWK